MAERDIFVGEYQSQGPGGMLVESTEFVPGGDLSQGLVETGELPTLAWRNIPAGTSELVVLVHTDDSNQTPLMWVVAGFAPSSTGLFRETPPPGVRALPRADGELYFPGYPEPGSLVVFTLCALAEPLSENAIASDAWDACYSDNSNNVIGLATASAVIPVGYQARFVPEDQSQGPGGMLVESLEFTPGGELPLGLVQTGELPTLAWQNIPAGTSELVVLVTGFDPDIPSLLWVVAGFSPSSGGLFRETPPPGVRALTRSSGELVWPGYPEPGERVVFTLCALSEPLPPNATVSDAWNTCYSLTQETTIGLATVSALIPAS